MTQLGGRASCSIKPTAGRTDDPRRGQRRGCPRGPLTAVTTYIATVDTSRGTSR
jgi:hypothetical protein